jgi:hypothetical protein
MIAAPPALVTQQSLGPTHYPTFDLAEALTQSRAVTPDHWTMSCQPSRPILGATAALTGGRSRGCRRRVVEPGTNRGSSKSKSEKKGKEIYLSCVREES